MQVVGDEVERRRENGAPVEHSSSSLLERSRGGEQGVGAAGQRRGARNGSAAAGSGQEGPWLEEEVDPAGSEAGKGADGVGEEHGDGA